MDVSLVSMSRQRENTPGFSLDGHCVLDTLSQRLAGSDGIFLSALHGKHRRADREQRTQRKVLIFDAATEDDAVHVLVSKTLHDETTRTRTRTWRGQTCRPSGKLLLNQGQTGNIRQPPK